MGLGLTPLPCPGMSCSDSLGSSVGALLYPHLGAEGAVSRGQLREVAESPWDCPCAGAGPEAGEAGEDHSEALEAAESLHKADPGAGR